MDLFVIRHRDTGQLMPQLKKNRGYTHWNPSKQGTMHAVDLGVPRLLTSERQAKTVVRLWLSMPNAEYRGYTNYAGEDDYGIDIKEDGRKETDLEIIKAALTLEPL